MKKAALLCVMAMLCLSDITNAQNIKALSVGDYIPQKLFNSIYKKTHQVPTLVEFFLTTCGSCIKGFPPLNQFQKQYGDSIQILLVSSETKQKLSQFFTKNTIAKTNNLSWIAEDTLLSQYLPFEAVPHLVWIAGDGKILAISGTEYLTETNIKSFVAGNPPNIPLSVVGIKYDPSTTLFNQANGSSDRMHYSAFTGYLKGTSNNMYGKLPVGDHNTKWYYINMGVLSILQQVLGAISANRFVIDSSLISRFINVADSPGLYLYNFYCYELTLPKDIPKDDAACIILNDLSRFLNVSISVDSITTSCYVLKKISRAKNIVSSKRGTPEINLFTPSGHEKVLKNQPLSRLIKAMNSGKWKDARPVVIDETGITYPVDIRLQVTSINKIPEMQKALLPYGLQLEPVIRKIPMVVIKPRANKTLLPIKF